MTLNQIDELMERVSKAMVDQIKCSTVKIKQSDGLMLMGLMDGIRNITMHIEKLKMPEPKEEQDETGNVCEGSEGMPEGEVSE